MIGIRLEKNKKISITKDVIEYTSPKTVYIPLQSGNDTNITVLVKKNEYVCKGQIIGKVKGKNGLPIFSSVSGTVKEFITKSNIKCVVIENDYEEREEHKQEINDITSYTKESFINKLRVCGITGMSGSGTPTYIKYENKLKTLIVNAVECEPYITSDYMLIKTKIEEILECCDAIMEINEIEECYFAIKVRNDELKEIIKTYIGTYPKIKIIEVPDIYPMGWEKSLVRYIKHIDYKTCPAEKEIVVNNVSTIYAIYEAIKYNKPLIERIVTFTGNVKKPQNIKVKIGTSSKEILQSIVKLNVKDYLLISGGPMMGYSTLEDDIIISSNINCVLVLEKKSNIDSIECLRCGKCVRVCPVKLTPVLIKDNVDNLKKLKKLNVDKCIECGLCTYQCPSKIDVKEYIKLAKEKLRKED